MYKRSEFILRQANSNDAQALVLLVNSAYRPQTPTTAWTHEADLVLGQRISLDDLLIILQSDAPILVLTQQEHILACVQITLLKSEAHIGLLSVQPEFQNLSLGKIMLDYAEKTAQQKWTINNFKMSVITTRTSLVSYYLRRGYQHTGDFFTYPIEANVGIPKLDLTLEYLIKPIDQS